MYKGFDGGEELSDFSHECIRIRSGFGWHSSGHLCLCTTQVKRLCTREWTCREGPLGKWGYYCLVLFRVCMVKVHNTIIDMIRGRRYRGFCGRIQLPACNHGPCHGWVNGPGWVWRGRGGIWCMLEASGGFAHNAVTHIKPQCYI